MHTRDDAAEILTDYMDLLAEPFPSAWGKWAMLKEDWPEVAPLLSSRARASMIHDWAAARASTLFADMAPKVTLHDAHGFLLIVIDGLHIRLKKFRNGSMTTSGIPTQQQLTFAAQEPLPGMPKATNLVLGYSLNPFQTEIERLAITCTQKGKRHWYLDVPIPGGAVVIERPAAPIEPPPPSIRSRREEEQEERDTSEGS